jgi:hypothetical protein
MMRLVKVMGADNNELRKQLETAVIITKIERETFK